MSTAAELSPVIVTDGGCDLPPALIEKYDIHFAPLSILFGEEIYRSMIDISHDEFYARLAKGDVHPTTSQPTVLDFVTLYQELAKLGRPILSIHISEGLSGTGLVAQQAARQLPDLPITYWNSGTLSSPLGMQVLAAARAAHEGYTVEQILPILEQTHRDTELLFTVDDLSYLHRGGRIGSVRYQVGQLLHIKPIITVCKEGEKAGTYIPAGRARSMQKAISSFIQIMTERVGAGATIRVLSLYGDDPTLAIQLNEALADAFDCVMLDMVPTAPVLGVHTGPGALGLAFSKGDWLV